MSDSVAVLLIDDNEFDYILTQRILQAIPHPRFSLDWISKFSKAVEELQAGRHDVVLMDYRLGPHSGLELLSRFPLLKMPVIVLTGEDDPAIDMKALQLGAMD